MKEDIQNQIDEKKSQILKLQREVNELTKKLNNITEQTTLSKEEKLKIYMDYFKGRDDVYPYFSISRNNPSLKFYSPACYNEWKKGVCNKTMNKKCKDCQYKNYIPVTSNVYEKHIYDNKTVGIYPMLEDDTCYFLVFDFDDKKDEKNIKDDILAFWSVCDEYNVPIAVERSRSGHGFHIWLFFNEKIKALTARKLGTLLLSKTIEVRDSLKFASFDRMFPSQDYLPVGGFGNLIALPFQTEPTRYGNSLFVDKYFNAIKGQFNYLKSVKKLSLNEVFELIKTLSNNTININEDEIATKEKIKNKKTKIKYPKQIHILLDNMIYIDKKDLTAGFKGVLRKLASFYNPEFFMMQKLRKSTYNIPLVIDCSKIDDKYIMLPRGTFEYIQEMSQTNNIRLIIDDKRNSGKKIKVKFNGQLKKEQEDALKEMNKFENGILHAPTGFGKTVVACKMIDEKKVNTLIIVHKLELLHQWKKKIKEFLNIEEIGEIGGGKNKITNIVDVASIKTLWNNGNFHEIIKNYGMVIIDECHHTAAFTYESVVNEVNAKYVYGFTATPDRENGHTPIVKMQCGNIRYEVNFQEFNKELGLPMKVITKEIYLNFLNKNITNYTFAEINDLIAKDIIRSEKILEDIKSEFAKSKNILIITERIEHLEYFKEKLSELTENLFVYNGGIGKKKLLEYENLTQKVKENNEKKIILATGAYIGEGFDDPNLEVMFLTMPISGITRVIQYTGRLHRKIDNKKEITIYDYVDMNFSETRNMYKKRKKTYEKQGYEIIEESNRICETLV